MRILLAIDGSGHSEAAVNEIARRQWSPGDEVRVISVVEPYLPPTFVAGGWADGNFYVDVERAARDRARVAVEKAEATLRAGETGRQRDVRAEVLSGSPKRVILEDAEAFGADLIVVGSHGHGALDRVLLGSVSQAVALHAECSVEIVRRRKNEDEHQ